MPMPTGICDPLCQTGCPTGQACLPNAPFTSTMCGCAGSTPAKATCSSATCRAGAACLGSAMCGTKCTKFCRADSDCGFPDLCAATAGSFSVCVDGMVMCDPTLPAASTSCGAAPNVCYVYIGATSERGLCACPVGVGVDGTTCTSANACQAGFVCNPEGGPMGVCRRVCKLAGPSCPPFPLGRTCRSIAGVSVTYGACAP